MGRKTPRIPNLETALRRERRKRGLKILQVCIEADIDVGGLSRIERGLQHPTPATAKKLFHFYGGAVPIERILIPEDFYE